MGGANKLIIDSRSYAQDPNSYDFGFMPDSAIGGAYGKVTVVY